MSVAILLLMLLTAAPAAGVTDGTESSDAAAGLTPALPTPPRFVLRDQYGGPIAYPLAEELSNSVVLIAAADRRGADANRDWASALAARYSGHIEARAEPRLVILPVAHLKAVPRILRSVVRSFFREGDSTKEPTIPIGLDWKGDVARQLGLEKGVPNVYVLDRLGSLVIRTAGEVDDAGEPVFETLDRLLQPHAGSSR